MASKVTRRAFLALLGATAVAGGVGVSEKLGWTHFRGALAPKYVERPLELAVPAVLRTDNFFDVCIIGSGFAGTVLARDLVEHGLRVAILESGLGPQQKEFYRQAGGLNAYETVGELPYPLEATRARAVGGTSVMWTGRCIRFHPLDFERNAFTPPDAAWPISYNDIEPYYERAEQTLRVRGAGVSEYDAPRRNDFPLRFEHDVPHLKSLLGSIGITVDKTPSSTGLVSAQDESPIRVARDLLPELSASNLATVVSGATVTRLDTDSEGRVTRAEVQSLAGETKYVRARVFVIAAGAVETARLLLLSRSDRFPEGIGNDSGLLGRYFTEHPNLTFKATLPDRRGPQNFERGRSKQFYDAFKKQGLGSVLFFFKRDPAEPEVLELGATLEMQPVTYNLVALSKKVKDIFGNPGARLSLSASENDRRTMDAVRNLARDICADLGAHDLQEQNMTWSHHHMGTCRMGNDPRYSVTDQNLCVHGAPGLYIAGSAVFVTTGAAHPTLALVALTHRLADHLLTQIPTW